MQKKRNTKFRAVDLLIILICLAGSVLSGSAFWQEYNRTFTKLNEEAIGTIIFKKRTAQRKFIDRMVWDRLKQASEIYNGDTIRTIEFSEVLITFRNDITHLTLSENTIVQIFYDDIEGARIEFSGGNLEVVSGTQNVLVNAGSSRIVINGQANLSMREEGFSLSVLEGDAFFNDELIESGNIASITAEGEVNINPAIIMQSFGSSARIINSQRYAPCEFAWLTSNFKPDTYVIIEISLNKNFDRIVQKMEITDSLSAVINLESGNYWWRVYPADSGSAGMPVNNLYPTGTMEVIYINEFFGNFPEILPVTIVNQEQVFLYDDNLFEPEPEPVITAVASLPLRQSAPPPIASRPQSARPIDPVLAFSPEVSQTSFNPVLQPAPDAVLPEPEPPAPIVQITTETETVNLLQTAENAAISNITPPENFIIYIEQLRNTPHLRFSWSGRAAGYEFALYRENGSVIVQRAEATGANAGNYVYTLNNPEILQEGIYIWHIYEITRRGANPELPAAAIRLIIRNEPVPRRTLPTVNPGELYGN